MKKTLVIIVVMAFFGMYWVSAAEKEDTRIYIDGPLSIDDYPWIDQNTVGTDSFVPYTHLTVNGRMAGAWVSSDLSIRNTVMVINDLPGMVWKIDDVNQVFEWEYTGPESPAILYARFQVRVIEPYPAGSKYLTIAIQVVPELLPKGRVWYEYLID